MSRAQGRMPAASFFGGRGRLRSRLAVGVFVAGLSGCLLLGCAPDYRTYGASGTKPPPIPLPKQTLLQPQREPGCTSEASGLPGGPPGGVPGREGQTPKPPGALAHALVGGLAHAPARVASLAVDGSDRSAPPAGSLLVQADPNASPNANLAQRIKLEYERDCFRRAEARVRYRLLRLQVAVGATVKAVKRAEQAVP